MSAITTSDPLDAMLNQQYAAARAPRPAADPLDAMLDQQFAAFRGGSQNPEAFAAGGPSDIPPSPVLTREQLAAEVAQVERQASDAQRPLIERAAGFVGGAAMESAQRADLAWRNLNRFIEAGMPSPVQRPLSADAAGGPNPNAVTSPVPMPFTPATPEEAVLPQIVASAAGVPAMAAPAVIQRMQEVGEHADPVTKFVGGLAAMPVETVNPNAIAAMLATGGPVGSLARAGFVKRGLGAVAERFGPGVASAVQKILHGSAGVGAFSGAQTLLETADPGAALEAAGHGAAGGALLGGAAAAVPAIVGRFAKYRTPQSAPKQAAAPLEAVKEAEVPAPALPEQRPAVVSTGSEARQVPELVKPENKPASATMREIPEPPPLGAEIKEPAPKLEPAAKAAAAETKATPEPPPTQPAAGIPKDPEKIPTSARKSMLDEDRANMGLDTLDSPTRRSWEAAHEEAKAGGIPEKALRIAEEVNEKPRALSDVETAGMVQRAAALKNEHRKLLKEIGESTDPADVVFKGAEAERVEGEFDQLSRAIRSSGTEKGRALASQRLTLDQDFDLLTIKTRAKAAKGAELSPKETAKLTELTTKLEETTKRAEAAELALAEKQAEAALTRHRAVRRVREPKLHKAEVDRLAARVRELISAGCH